MKMIRASGWRIEIQVTFLAVGGVLFSRTDRMGHITQYTYDGLGRLLSALHDDNTGQGYQYDGQKLIASGSHTYSYDSSWRVVTDAIPGGETKTFTYYANGSLASYTIQPPSGTTTPPQSVSYPYTVGGQVPGESWSWIPNGSFTFQYTATGQYSTISFPNGQQRRFTYDNQDRLTNITNTSPSGATIASFDYGYDFDWPTNSYSMRGQRTSVFVTAPGASNIVAGLAKYTYDNRYQLVRAGYPNNSFDAWTYDAIGNRLSKTVLNGGTTIPYAYFTNAAGGNTQRLRNDGFYDFTYNADGDVTAASTQYGSTVYGWDHGNRLTSYGGTTYTYDSVGRTSATTSGSTTRYIGMDGNTVGVRNTAAGVTTDYIFGPGIDEPLAKRMANGSITYYGVDGLGSVVVSTDPTGAVLNSNGYSPWGEMIFTTPELFGYTGRETGGPSWYYRARYYDAPHGRFLSEDPLQFMMGPNFYVYVHNNPSILKDPFGLGDVVRFPGNPKPRPPFPNCWPDTRIFDEPPFDQRPTGIGDVGRAGARAAVTIALAAVNIIVWNCVIAEAYCASQSDYCDCMKYANPSGYCKDIFGGCRQPQRPRNAPPPLPCGTCPISH